MAQEISPVSIHSLLRSKRKTISIQVDEEAHVIVKAPFSLSREKIDDIVLKHQKWIIQKQQEILSREVRYQPKQFKEGEIFYFLGKPYSLSLIAGEDKEPLRLKDKFYLLKSYQPRAREVFYQWYQKESEKVITPLISEYAGRYNFRYQTFKITRANKRWGSCSTKGRLFFSWRLVMAPMEVIRYVVVHELVHLHIPNHSKDFWKKVADIMPSYLSSRKFLEKYGYLYQF